MAELSGWPMTFRSTSSDGAEKIENCALGTSGKRSALLWLWHTYVVGPNITFVFLWVRLVCWISVDKV